MTLDVWPEAPDLRRDDISFHFRGNNYQGHLVAPRRKRVLGLWYWSYIITRG